MSLTPRGKISILFVAALVVTGAALGYFLAFPEKAPPIVQRTLSTVGLADALPPAPPSCPLTGEAAPKGHVPDRPALAVKIENAPEARPQAGLNEGDVIYEEPVEGGYTRFIVVYQCHDAVRVGPVRSVRTTDPDVLAQFGIPVLAFSGGALNVLRAVEDADLVTLDETSGGPAFERDASRVSPHNLYAGTRALYRVARSKEPAPEPVFTYSDGWDGKAKRVSTVHLPYSGVSDVYWTWSRREGMWLRSHGDTAHIDEGGGRISATNVVVQVVQVTASQIIDAAGNTSPDVTLTGSGKAYVFRDGRVIVGRWERRTLDDLTRFTARDGSEITLAPGRTWVELLPASVAVELTR